MDVTLKLFANLSEFLPQGAQQNAFIDQVAEGTSVRDLLIKHNVPLPRCHLILINGVYTAPAKAAEARLKHGDVVSVWPPVAGG
jgi:molybdopterin converting factor small subunit